MLPREEALPTTAVTDATEQGSRPALWANGKNKDAPGKCNALWLPCRQSPSRRRNPPLVFLLLVLSSCRFLPLLISQLNFSPPSGHGRPAAPAMAASFADWAEKAQFDAALDCQFRHLLF